MCIKKAKRKIKPASYSRCISFLHIQRHKNGLCFNSLLRCIITFPAEKHKKARLLCAKLLNMINLLEVSIV